MSGCMRTTIRMNDDLLVAAKKLAASTGRTLTSLIEDAVREALARSTRPAPKQRLKLKTFRGTGLRNGVDLDDAAALAEAMEST